MNKLFILPIFTTLSFFSISQDTEIKKGNTTLPSTSEELLKLAEKAKGNFNYSVADYFAHPKQSSFKFSPDGKYISYTEKDDKGKTHVYVKNTSSNEIKRVIEETTELIRDYDWVNNQKLIYVQDKGGNENYHIFSINIDGSNTKELTPYEGVRVDILKFLKEQPNLIIVQMNKENPQVSEPYKINIETGEVTKLFENKDIENPISGFDFDKDGILKGYSKQENGTDYTYYYRTDLSNKFDKIMTTNWKQTFGVIGFNYASPNPHDAFVVSNLESNTDEIVLYDFKEKKIIQKLYSNANYDIRGISTSRLRNYEVDFYHYEGDKEIIVPISKTYFKLLDSFKKQFGDKQVYITSVTDDETKYLLYVTSDKLYGSYYYYDFVNNTYKEMFNMMPQLKEEEMAEMRPIQFKTRDGLIVHGYITIPKNAAKNHKVSLIINPHGGPYGVRDSWGFNPETQLFASRGYATLQVNYRGSGGYGKEFFLAGSKQIGRNMLNDLEDAVAYAKTLEFIDDQKIAIYGASYGGLATLGSLVKTPELYTCGIDYVGVSNLFTFYKSFPEYWKPYLKQMYEQWYDETITEDQKIMKEVSPALNVDKIKKPLFVVQGANDPRVNIDESDQVVVNLRKRGFDIPYMVKYNEGHGFGHEENQIQLYECMLGFFATHLK